MKAKTSFPAFPAFLLFVLILALLAACTPAATPTAAPTAAPSATAAPDAEEIVLAYYDAVNAADLDGAMAFIAADAIFVNPIGVFRGTDAVRESLQIVIDEGITFELSNLRETDGRVVYDYTVVIGGEAVETGTDGLTVVEDGLVVLDTTERWEWLAYVHQAEFAVTDDGFTHPETLPAGWTEISLTNDSQGVHHVQLVRLDEGKTTDDLIAALEADPLSFPDWGVPYGGPNAPDPGATTSAVVLLDPGSYALISGIPGPDGLPGYLTGMVSSLTVTAADQPAAAEPQADIDVNLTEFMLAAPATVTAGQHVFAIRNAGAQAHELYLVKLNEGVTAEDYLNAPLDQPPPAVGLGGITGIIPGAVQYLNLNLEPGTYAMFCFFADPASGAPHFVLGMVLEFTVE